MLHNLRSVTLGVEAQDFQQLIRQHFNQRLGTGSKSAKGWGTSPEFCNSRIQGLKVDKVYLFVLVVIHPHFAELPLYSRWSYFLWLLLGNLQLLLRYMIDVVGGMASW